MRGRGFNMILVTGGLGFIGLHTARALLDMGESVVLTRYRSSAVPDFLQDEVGKRVFVEGVDLTSPFDVIDVCRRHKVTAICDLFVPRRGALSPGEDLRVKTVGLVNVLEAGRIAGVKRVAHASSVAVYGSLKNGPFREDLPLPLQSTSETEAFKKAQETLAGHYSDRTGLEVAFLRIGFIYGPLYLRENRMNPRLIKAGMTGTPASWAGLPEGDPYEQDSGDATYAKDCARACALLTVADKLPNRAYNIGGPGKVTNLDIANAVKKVYPNLQFTMKPGLGPRGDQGDTSLDLTRIKNDVGYVPEYDINRGMAEWIDYLKTHPM